MNATAEVVEKRLLEQERQAKEKARRKHLAQIAADPQKAIAQAAELVSHPSTDSYESAAQLLADLRETLGPNSGPQRAQAAAEHPFGGTESFFPKLDGSPTGAVAVYDAHRVAAVVASHSPQFAEGQVIDLSPLTE